jgi:hypothetical protein
VHKFGVARAAAAGLLFCRFDEFFRLREEETLSKTLHPSKKK